MRYIYLCLIYSVLFCKQHGPNSNRFTLPLARAITSPQFTFEYGMEEKITSHDANFYIEESGSICLYSLPVNLYYRETGARFNLCLPAEKDAIESLKKGFNALDDSAETTTLFYIKEPTWEASTSTYGKWQKENKDTTPLDSFSENHTMDGTISYSRFDIPVANYYKWTTNRCEVTFPSRLIGPTKSSWKFLSIKFDCGEISFQEVILSQNEKWLSQCVQKFPTHTESFRHSDSPFGRFLEWSNDTEDILCPIFDNFSFYDNTSKKLINLETNTLGLLRENHKLILGHSSFLMKTSEQLSGLSIDDALLSNIGKDGEWILGSLRTSEKPYNFKQGDEFFSKSVTNVSCRNHIRFQISEIPICMSPGIPNHFLRMFETETHQTPSCKLNQLRITEFFSGISTSKNIPSYVELQNLGEACDLSNIVLGYEQEEFILSSQEKIIQPKELVILSREKWEGWNFQSLVKPFSLKEFKFRLPSLYLRDLESGFIREFKQNENDFVITNWNGITNRSMLIGEDGFVYPHPNILGSSIHMSPGTYVNELSIPFLFLPISEILLSGTKDNLASYSERFIEWFASNKAFGYVFFEIQSDKKERFIFVKEEGIEFPVVKSGTGVCLSAAGMFLPEGSLSNANTKISLLNRTGNQMSANPQYAYSYHTNVYEAFGLQASARMSIHPEEAPFLQSISAVNSFPSPCSPNSEATPGRVNSKQNQIASYSQLTASMIPYVSSYQFLEEPGKSSTFQYRSLNKLQTLILNMEGLVWDMGHELVGNLFSERELVYFDWFDSNTGKLHTQIHRLGEVRMEAVYPTPVDSQNEWLYFCNITDHPVSTLGYSIEDESSRDSLVPYAMRFPTEPPSLLHGTSIRWNDPLLNPGDCAFVVDPDGRDWYFPPFTKASDILLTVSSSQTIGNAIGGSENLDLYKDENGEKFLLSTYGKKGTNSSFQIPLKTSEYSLLRKESIGNQASDFQVYREIQ